MTRTLHVDPKDAVPIWRQIEHGFRRLIASGGLAAGAPVPSVRDLARELRVNPNTVAKAYQRLTDLGVLAVKRGEGTFVADSPKAMPRAERQKTLREAASRYASLALTIGVSGEEAVFEVESALGRFARGVKGGGA